MGEARDRGPIGYVILDALDRLHDMAVYEDHDEAAQDASWCNLFEKRDGPWRVVALVEELMATDTEEKSDAENMDAQSKGEGGNP